MEALLRTIDGLISNPSYLDYFEKMRSVLYLSIVCPLLEMDADDRLNFKDNPTEFLESVIFTANGGRYADDKDDNNDVTIRAFAARVFGSICRYQDGFVKTLFEGSIATLTQPNCAGKSLLLL